MIYEAKANRFDVRTSYAYEHLSDMHLLSLSNFDLFFSLVVYYRVEMFKNQNSESEILPLVKFISKAQLEII